MAGVRCVKVCDLYGGACPCFAGSALGAMVQARERLLNCRAPVSGCREADWHLDRYIQACARPSPSALC